MDSLEKSTYDLVPRDNNSFRDDSREGKNKRKEISPRPPSPSELDSSQQSGSNPDGSNPNNKNQNKNNNENEYQQIKDKDSCEIPPFLSLPRDVLLMVFSLLDVGELLALEETSILLKKLINEDFNSTEIIRSNHNHHNNNNNNSKSGKNKTQQDAPK